jgi:hypothetical protein
MVFIAHAPNVGEAANVAMAPASLYQRGERAGFM